MLFRSKSFRQGKISHPGVTEQELAFLAQVSQRIQHQLEAFFKEHSTPLSSAEINTGIEASILDNVASPTANLNTFYEKLKNHPETYAKLQETIQTLMENLLEEAKQAGLTDSFFIHYAPNLGRDETGKELLRPATENDSGTTDFQFMIRGAIKEAGVLAILNRYYSQRTGTYPLGETFNVRNAPNDYTELLQLVRDHFDFDLMPILIGVGDTVNSSVAEINGKLDIRRGGSDRAFLQLIQDIHPHNLTVYIDSSGGEVKNRKPVRIETPSTGKPNVVELPTDANDPLTLNLIFPNGHNEYTTFFRNVAATRGKS